MRAYVPEAELGKVALGIRATVTTDSFPGREYRGWVGYKQRLALACALMHEPDILFLDEPTSGVDPLARRDFWQRINHLAESGVTILVTTHFVEEAEYCDRLVILAHGRIFDEGSSEAIKARFRDAAHPEPTREDAFVALVEEDAGRKAV